MWVQQSEAIFLCTGVWVQQHGKNRDSRLDGLQVSLENMLPVEAPCLFCRSGPPVSPENVVPVEAPCLFYFFGDQSDACSSYSEALFCAQACRFSNMRPSAVRQCDLKMCFPSGRRACFTFLMTKAMPAALTRRPYFVYRRVGSAS